MRTIAPLPAKYQLPLFAWAERQRLAALPVRMTAYRLDKTLSVYPVWEVRHG